MRRVVFWQDSNGCIFILNHIGSEGSNDHPLVIEDITVVYSRYRGVHFSSGTSCSFCNDMVVYLCFVSLADTTK